MADAANMGLKLAQARYKLGLSSIVELSQSQLEQTQASIENVNAQYEYQLSLAALNYQLGTSAVGTDLFQDHRCLAKPKIVKGLAPQVGLEPTTLRLTAECSAIELLRSGDAVGFVYSVR